MRIGNIYTMQGINRPASNVSRSKTEKTFGTKDAFTPSALATDFNVARRAVAASPDVRADRVNDIIERINSGEYNVSAADVARKIIDQIG